MRKIWGCLGVLLLFSMGSSSTEKISVELENLTWVEAEKVLAEFEVALIALAPAAGKARLSSRAAALETP